MHTLAQADALTEQGRTGLRLEANLDIPSVVSDQGDTFGVVTRVDRLHACLGRDRIDRIHHTMTRSARVVQYGRDVC